MHRTTFVSCLLRIYMALCGVAGFLSFLVFGFLGILFEFSRGIIVSCVPPAPSAGFSQQAVYVPWLSMPPLIFCAGIPSFLGLILLH